MTYICSSIWISSWTFYSTNQYPFYRPNDKSITFNWYCYLSLHAAFDCVPTGILLAKLQTWFKSCLTGYTQFARFNGENSYKRTLPWGIPQGSTLVPLLLSIFVSDMFNLFTVLFSALYADNTYVFYKRRGHYCII